MVVIYFILYCCYLFFFIVCLLWGRIPPARQSASILDTVRIQRISNVPYVEELVIKIGKTKHESTGSI